MPLLALIPTGLNLLFNSNVGRWLLVGVLAIVGAFAWTKHVENQTLAKEKAQLQAETAAEHGRRDAAEALAQQGAAESLSLWEQWKIANETVRTVVVREKATNDRSPALSADAVERLRSVGGGGRQTGH